MKETERLVKDDVDKNFKNATGSEMNKIGM